MIDEEVISLAEKIIKAVILLLTASACAWAAPLPDAPLTSQPEAHSVPLSLDISGTHTPSAWREEIGICVLSVCEDDLALEAAVKLAAVTELLKLDGVTLSDDMESSSVIISFVSFKERDSQGMQTGRILYSFAYGTPDIEDSDGVLIALPRYLHHEPILATRETLEMNIADNIRKADVDFFQFLRLP